MNSRTSRRGRLQSWAWPIFQVGRAPVQGERLGPFPAPWSIPSRRPRENDPTAVDVNGGSHDAGCWFIAVSNEWLRIGNDGS